MAQGLCAMPATSNVCCAVLLRSGTFLSSCARYSYSNPLHAIRRSFEWASELQGLLDLVEVIGVDHFGAVNLATAVSSMAGLEAAPDERARATQHHAFALLRATISALQGLSVLLAFACQARPPA